MDDNDRNQVKENGHWKGSRLRCILFTNNSKEVFINSLLNLINPSQLGISVDIKKDCVCYPNGYVDVDEVKLGKSNKLITASERIELNDWWLGRKTESSRDKDTPNWDIACSAKINSRDGLVLVEAKAYKGELWKKDDKSGADPLGSLVHIKNALQEANAALNNHLSGFRLRHDEHYQISNRFAWSWKLASMNIPVILIYLGFLNAHEMNTPTIFKEHDDWNKCVENYCYSKIPFDIWDSEVKTEKASFYPIIRSIEIQPYGVIK